MAPGWKGALSEARNGSCKDARSFTAFWKTFRTVLKRIWAVQVNRNHRCEPTTIT
jgi:hypothetical protein